MISYQPKQQRKKDRKLSGLDIAVDFNVRWLEKLNSPVVSSGCCQHLISAVKKQQVHLQGWPLVGPKHKHCVNAPDMILCDYVFARNWKLLETRASLAVTLCFFRAMAITGHEMTVNEKQSLWLEKNFRLDVSVKIMLTFHNSSTLFCKVTLIQF